VEGRRHNRGWFVLVALLVGTAVTTRGQTGASCVVIYDVAADTYWRSDAKACAVRLSPASTFKIPHALIALETGVVTPQTLQQWDGTKYATRPAWERPHALESAIQNSVLWFFQRTAVKIGPTRMRSFLERFRYGNLDTSGPPDQYWVNGRLRISADEQVDFLRRFYARDLAIRQEHHETVFHALIEPPGGVQNATGIHTLSANWKKSDTLSAKTGAGMAFADPEVRVSWLVGRLSAGGKDYIFASNTVRRGQLDPVDAARQAFKVFRERHLID
jgi:beta-lactamase class D